MFSWGITQPRPEETAVVMVLLQNSSQLLTCAKELLHFQRGMQYMVYAMCDAHCIVCVSCSSSVCVLIALLLTTQCAQVELPVKLGILLAVGLVSANAMLGGPHSWVASFDFLCSTSS